MTIRVQREDFDVGAEIAALSAGNHRIGGLTSFTGLVRNMGASLGAMTLEHYPGMTEKMLAAIDAQAHERWPLEASLIIHRYGRLEPGDRIVLVITASPHRDAAFDGNNQRDALPRRPCGDCRSDGQCQQIGLAAHHHGAFRNMKDGIELSIRSGYVRDAHDSAAMGRSFNRHRLNDQRQCTRLFGFRDQTRHGHHRPTFVGIDADQTNRSGKRIATHDADWKWKGCQAGGFLDGGGE